MKRYVIPLFIFALVGLLSGCCTDQVACGTDASFITYTTTTCNTCNTCSTCGYDASYTYSGWY